MLFYEPHTRPKDILPHDPFKALIAPRPIGWISSRDETGAINLAPYSFFNAFCSNPPIIGFSSEGEKDTLTFARQSGEFVWNLASFDLRDGMNASAAPLPRGQSEFVPAQLTPAPCHKVKAPRVQEASASFECKVTQILTLCGHNGVATAAHVVFGEVVGVHLDPRFIKDGRVDVAAMAPLARCGYDDYTTLRDLFALRRPV